MKLSTKLWALCLCLALIVSLFSACKPAETTPANNGDNTPGQTEGGDTQTPALNTEGAKIKAICYEQDSKDNDLVRETINEKLGFEIEWLVCPASEGWAAQDRLLAADPTIDMFYLGTARMSEYLSKGYLMDITAYTDDERLPNIKEYSSPRLPGTAAPDGNYYGFPIPGYGSYGSTNGYGLAIRQDWLKEANLEMPKTIDDLDKILAAFKEKNPSKYPLIEEDGANGGSTSIVFARSFSESGMGWWIDESDGGKLKHWIQNPDYKKFVEKKKEWYDKGYLHPEFVTVGKDGPTQLMAASEVGVVAAWCTNPINPNVALMEEDPEARFDYIKGTLTGPAGGGLLGSAAANTFLGINVNSKYPDACAKAFDFFLTEEGTRLGAWGVEGTNYTTEGDTVNRAQGDHVYNNQYNPYTNQMWTTKYQTGAHYTDTQYVNWYNVFFSPERLEQVFFEPDCGLIYNYASGDNQYNELNTVANTYISEMIINMVTGKESLDNWDAKIAELEQIALNQMVKERNEQWESYGKPIYQAPSEPLLDPATKPGWVDGFVW